MSAEALGTACSPLTMEGLESGGASAESSGACSGAGRMGGLAAGGGGAGVWGRRATPCPDSGSNLGRGTGAGAAAAMCRRPSPGKSSVAAQGRFLTPQGELKVKWERTKADRLRAELVIPQGIELEIEQTGEILTGPIDSTLDFSLAGT